MHNFGLILNKNLIKITTKLQYSTKKLTNGSISPIKMSYASYESTRSTIGNGPSPLIVLHGLFGSKANWNTLCTKFHEKTFRKIVAVDLRNHGDSPHTKAHSYYHIAEDIKYLLDYLSINKASFLGHSVGGRAVMYFALKYPTLVDKLIIGDISPIKNSASFRAIIKIFVALQNVNLPCHVSMSAARLTADLQLSRTIHGRGLRAFLLQNLVQKSDGSYCWRINIPVLLDNFQRKILKFPNVTNFKFEGPVLFVCGGASDFIQKSEQRQILNLFPQAGFQTIEGAGHWLYSDKPKEFLHICSDFLNNKSFTGEVNKNGIIN